MYDFIKVDWKKCDKLRKLMKLIKKTLISCCESRAAINVFRVEYTLNLGFCCSKYIQKKGILHSINLSWNGLI